MLQNVRKFLPGRRPHVTQSRRRPGCLSPLEVHSSEANFLLYSYGPVGVVPNLSGEGECDGGNFIGLIGATAGAAAWPTVGSAQQRLPTIGVLWPGAEPPAAPRMESFRQALRQLGFVEGQNLAIELRYARKGLQQLSELADELVGMKVDVLTTFGDLSPKIAQQATQTISIVAISDDLGRRIITPLSRPDRNTTGLTIMSQELSAKRLEVLREIVPGICRVAALWIPTTGASQVAQTESAARSFKLDLQIRRSVTATM